MMRYLEFDSVTGKNHIAETVIPTIQPYEVLVKVQAFGVNRADLLQKEGKYPPPGDASPILGMEVSGIVDKVGGEVGKEYLGQSVCAMIVGGGYAEYVAVNVEHLIPISGKMELIQCCGLPEVFLTAYQSLFQIGKIRPGQKVLIHAGASGVGTAVIQLARFYGCQVAVTTSSTKKNDACYKLGADIAINYKEREFTDVLKEQRFFPDVIIDMVGEGNLQGNISIAALDCVIVQLAMLGGRFVTQLDLAKLLGKRIQLQGSTLRNRSDDYKSKLVQGLLHDFGDAITDGKIHPIVDRIYSAGDIDLAHQRMAQNLNIGKLLVKW